MSKAEVIWSVVYVLGYIIGYAMMKVEHEADQRTYTKIDRVLCIVFSLLSFILVIGLLVSAWFKKIAITGYWNRPVKKATK